MIASAFRAALLAFGILACAGAASAQTADLQKIEIASKSGTHSFQVELAQNDEERSRGLMYRKELPEGRGMLFDFKQEQDVSFWMKNTYIPLDMIFIRADGTIRRIAANTEPLSERGVPAGGPVRYVLEVIGGTARKLGIEPGDKVTGAPCAEIAKDFPRLWRLLPAGEACIETSRQSHSLAGRSAVW